MVSEENAPADRWSDWHLLLLLFALVLPLRLWLLYNTEVAARDSIGFIRYALQFETKPWKEVLLGNHQHPGYPLAIWAVSQPVRAIAGTDAATMRVSAQLVSMLAALALLVPMYFLGKVLFDRQVGFWAALLFQYFPVSGHHLSDGISEALFLFLIAMALWRGALGVRQLRAREFAWCGFWGGLAYLTRPEGALVVMAAGLVLAGLQLIPGWRRPWSKVLSCSASLATAAAAVGSIYVLTTGHLTNKPAPQIIRATLFSDNDGGPAPRQPSDGPPALAASVLGVFFQRADHFPLRLARSVGAIGAEFSQGFHYVGWIPAVLALAWGWPRLKRDQAFWMLAGYCMLHGVILLLLAMVESYVSDRHMMPLILCGTFFTVAGLRELAAWVIGRWQNNSFLTRLRPKPASLAALLAGGLVLFCLPKTVQRLHGNRAGNHQAGLWLARQLTAGDVVLDDHAYTHYYAGQVFTEGNEPVLPRDVRPTCYVVITRGKDLEAEGTRKQKEEEVRRHAQLVYQWPENRQLEARVVIYSQPRSMTTNPWVVAP
jgi:hypothetical protein